MEISSEYGHMVEISSYDEARAFLDAVAEEVEEQARFDARAWPYHNDGKESRSVPAGSKK